MNNIDIDALASEFDMEDNENRREKKESFDVEQPIEYNPITIDPITIITNNINSANKLLTDIMREIASGNVSPRMYEVAANLISVTTQSADKIFTSRISCDTLDIKQKLARLKERELEMKEKFLELRQNKSKVVNQNLIFTDRETVLKMLKDKKQNLIGEGEEDERNDS